MPDQEAHRLDPQLGDELLARAERDQRARISPDPDAEAMSRVDADNLPWLRRMIAERGWPTRTMVGEEASRAAWLLVQHADRDPAFQRRCLDLLRAAAADGEASPREVAYLTDRVSLAEDREQEYGTQVTVRDGRWQPRRLRDPQTVDERRARVGLEPLARYLARFDPPTPTIGPCPRCGGEISFWPPDPGAQAPITCPGCGWTGTVSVEP